METIVVTANKRGQALQEVDGGVWVRTGAELDSANVFEVAELEKLVPSLVIKNRGNRAYANVSLRGVTSPDFYARGRHRGGRACRRVTIDQHSWLVRASPVLPQPGISLHTAGA